MKLLYTIKIFEFTLPKNGNFGEEQEYGIGRLFTYIYINELYM